MAKLKGCRPLDKINFEYSSKCGLLGDRIFRTAQLTKEAEQLKQDLLDLDREAAESKRQEDEIAAKASVNPPAGAGECSTVGEATT